MTSYSVAKEEDVVVGKERALVGNDVLEEMDECCGVVVAVWLLWCG